MISWKNYEKRKNRMNRFGKRAGALSLSLTLLTIAAPADIVEKSYKELMAKSIFTSNNPILQSGWYSFDGDNGENPDLSNANFVGSYYFGESGDRYRPIITGGFGFSKIEQRNVDLGRSPLSGDDIELDSEYLKAGVGINYNPTQDLGLVAGVSAMWMSTDGGGYDAAIALDGSDARDRKIRKLFDSDSESWIYDIYGSIVYHPVVGGYKSYFETTLHYLSIDYDHDISSSSGIDADFKAGFYTHELTRVMDLPVYAEFYLASNLLDSELSDIVGFDVAVSADLSIHWKIGPMIHIFDDAFKDADISFNLQGTGSNSDFGGWKATASFNIVKF